MEANKMEKWREYLIEIESKQQEFERLKADLVKVKEERARHYVAGIVAQNSEELDIGV